MSGPYQFSQDSARSPLDRLPPNLFPAGQPPSFKTNVNRMKTKKWVEAKQTSYDGGDWGDYDEYDEYGTEQEPPPPPQPSYQTGYGQKGQVGGTPSRSFTEPHYGGPPVAGRRNSFEAGDERQAFSTPVHQYGQTGGFPGQHPNVASPPGQPAYAAPPAPTHSAMDHVHPALRQPSGAPSDTSDTPQHRRDFSPSALPPPLQTRVSPAPGSASASPAGTRFPARKSSLSQMDSPASRNASPIPSRERAPSNPSKPLPFIRPAEIYKRLEEERERERASLDSSRPSLDSLSARPREETTSPQPLERRASNESLGRGGDAGRSLQPLETVAERKSEYLPDFNIHSKGSEQRNPAPAPEIYKSAPTDSKTSGIPTLPAVHGISDFESDFWSSGGQSQGAANVAAPQNDAGLRSVVDQAFTRADDDRSVPPTPISKQSDSGVSRSNTDSTSGISPIMSRVPSSAMSAYKNRTAEGQSSTPVITEETGETTPVPQQLLGGSHQIPRKPSPSHSRNPSSTSVHLTGLNTPSPHDSPARSPVIQPEKPLPEPESALITSPSASVGAAIAGGLEGPLPSYAEREADIAFAMKKSPDQAPALSAVEKESQAAFLESHNTPPDPILDAPLSRSGSPTKGRVHELANKFGEVSHSRRGSNASTSSVQSWERSQENSRPSSPVKAGTNGPSSPVKDDSVERPSAAREASFRPKLPGQWESYASVAPTPQGGDGKDPLQKGSEPIQSSEEVDLNPTTSKHPVVTSQPLSDPLAAVKAAGSALGDVIRDSVGLDASKTAASDADRGYSVGDVYMRPLQVDRTASSIASSAPPTPPAKDTPEVEELPLSPPLKEKSPEPVLSTSQEQTPTRPTILPQLSTDSDNDQESDRLRKEIVASLNPSTPTVTAQEEPAGNSLLPAQPGSAKRESSIFPSEYDSYWADGDTSPRASYDLGHNAKDDASTSLGQPQAPKAPLTSTTSAPSAVVQAPLLTRFSWESTTNATPPASGAQAQAGAETSADDQKEEREVSISAVHNKEIQSKEELKFIGAAQLTTHPPSAPLPNSSVASPAPEEPTSETAPAYHDGLHVVNTDLNPEAVDMPSRLSADAAAESSRPPEDNTDIPSPSQLEVAQSGPMVVSEPAHAPQTPVKSPASEKPLGFREIIALKSPSERIATYNKTRDYWANHDNGLSEWISSALAANPELVSQPLIPPQMQATATSRHKTTGSLSLFGKHHSQSNAQPQSNPLADPNSGSAGQLQESSTLSATTSQPQVYSPNTSGSGGRSASHQMQSKGKDLLHTAGVLGGKGMTSAKGFFSKNKSRFRASGSGDKVDH